MMVDVPDRGEWDGSDVAPTPHPAPWTPPPPPTARRRQGWPTSPDTGSGRAFPDDDRPTDILPAVVSDPKPAPAVSGSVWPRMWPDPSAGAVAHPVPAPVASGNGAATSPDTTNRSRLTIGHLPDEVDDLARSRPGSRRLHAVESFRGPRLHSHTGPWQRLRSMLVLVVVTIVMATIVTGVLAAVVGGIALAIRHLSGA